MQFTLATVALFLGTVSAVRLAWDPHYDDSNESLATVACSDGDNGLLTRNFTTFGSLPTFPALGGAPSIESWNSENCGSCFNLTYTPDGGNSTSVVFTGIDVGGDGFVGSQAALDALTGGRAVELGVVDVDVVQLNVSACGL